MFDPSVLLQAQGIQAPDPLQTMGRGLSLADMLMKVQQQQQMANYYKQSLGGDPGQQTSPFGLNMDALRANPMAAQSIIPQVLKFQEMQANIAKSGAETGKANQDTLDAKLKTLGNYASQASQNPTPQNLQGFARQYLFTGLPADALGSMPDDVTDVEGWKKYLGQASSIVSSPEQRSSILKTQTMTPIEAAKGVQDLGLNPQKVAISQQEADTGAAKQALAQQEFQSGKVVPVDGPNGKEFYVDQPGNGTRNITPAGTPGAPTPKVSVNIQGQESPQAMAWMAKDMASSPAAAQLQSMIKTNAQGAPTVGMGAGQKELTTQDAKTAAELNAQVPAAIQGLNTLYSIRNKVASGDGIYSGPIKGSDFFKSIAGVLSQLPGASDEMKAKVSNTQAFQADTGELAFNMLSSLKGSVPRAQQALNMIRAIKPDTVMTPQAMQQVMDAIESRFNDQINYAKQATAAIRGGGTLSDVGIQPRKGAAGASVNPDGSFTVNLQ